MYERTNTQDAFPKRALIGFKIVCVMRIKNSKCRNLIKGMRETMLLEITLGMITGKSIFDIVIEITYLDGARRIRLIRERLTYFIPLLLR